MITDKEYPATHSMSTAWYIVDDDDNVGILEYNDDGPVPKGVGEYSPEDLLWGFVEGEDSYQKLPLKLTLEQIYENLPQPHSVEEEQDWICCIVKIQVDKAERFKELCLLDESDFCICLSEEEGLYYFYDTPGLDTIIEDGIILEVYSQLSIWQSDDYDRLNDRVIHTKNYDSCSYFMYHQPYWERFLPQKISTPQHPVKLSQLPEALRPLVHRIPGNFHELDTFQIAEHYPCRVHNDCVCIGGAYYSLLPLPDGTEAYLLMGKFDNHQRKYTIDEVEALKKLGKAKLESGC